MLAIIDFRTGGESSDVHNCLFVCKFILPGCGVLDQI